jgi:hypothetical protein
MKSMTDGSRGAKQPSREDVAATYNEFTNILQQVTRDLERDAAADVKRSTRVEAGARKRVQVRQAGKSKRAGEGKHSRAA